MEGKKGALRAHSMRGQRRRGADRHGTEQFSRRASQPSVAVPTLFTPFFIRKQNEAPPEPMLWRQQAPHANFSARPALLPNCAQDSS
eukprot:scaffold434_cov186-Pinguiococcus_pyrenoidosus.AAC.116